MIVRYIRHLAGVVEGRVGGQGCVAAVAQPALQGLAALAGLQHHDFMVAAQGDELSAASLGDDPIEHGIGVGAAVHVIAERDENVIGPERYEVRQRGEGGETTVDIADCKVSQGISSCALNDQS